MKGVYLWSRSPTECGVPVYDRETSQRRRPWLNSGIRAVAKKGK